MLEMSIRRFSVASRQAVSRSFPAAVPIPKFPICSEPGTDPGSFGHLSYQSAPASAARCVKNGSVLDTSHGVTTFWGSQLPVQRANDDVAKNCDPEVLDGHYWLVI